MAKYNPGSSFDRIELADRIRKALTERAPEAPFARRPVEGVSEDVYVRRALQGAKDGSGNGIGVRDVYVVVYSTIEGGQMRSYASDAIRVSLVYRNPRTGQKRGLGKDARVFRVGEIPAIISRLDERIANMEQLSASLTWCERCGAPKFTSKNGNLVCAATCWLG